MPLGSGGLPLSCCMFFLPFPLGDLFVAADSLNHIKSGLKNIAACFGHQHALNYNGG